MKSNDTRRKPESYIFLGYHATCRVCGAVLPRNSAKGLRVVWFWRWFYGFLRWTRRRHRENHRCDNSNAERRYLNRMPPQLFATSRESKHFDSLPFHEWFSTKSKDILSLTLLLILTWCAARPVIAVIRAASNGGPPWPVAGKLLPFMVLYLSNTEKTRQGYRLRGIYFGERCRRVVNAPPILPLRIIPGHLA
jgi:hypothetical protein